MKKYPSAFLRQNGEKFQIPETGSGLVSREPHPETGRTVSRNPEAFPTCLRTAL
jgi:hypothetical protein